MNHYTTLCARAESARADVDMARDERERLEREVRRGNPSATAKRRLSSADAAEAAARLAFLYAAHEVRNAAYESSQQDSTDDSLSPSPRQPLDFGCCPPKIRRGPLEATRAGGNSE